MPDPGPDYWFPAKRGLGIGWGVPLRWQGWLTLVLYLAALAGGSLLLHHGLHMLGHLSIGIATALLILVCVLKGEPMSLRERD